MAGEARWARRVDGPGDTAKPLPRSLAGAAAALLLIGCQSRQVELGRFDYALNPAPKHCAAGARGGPAGATDEERSALGVAYSVRTPSNYDATMAHPLLMVFAPGGASRFASEALTGLTPDATRLGFVVAYADSVRMSVPNIEGLGAIPGLVANKWCIDESRIYYTGHSDGGTAALALSVLPQRQRQPAGIAPSAAGFTSGDLAGFACPAPIPVLVLHSTGDSLFKGYGSQIARWWAACNRCDGVGPSAQSQGCVAFHGCAAPTMFCEGHEGHPKWPNRNETILKLFSNQETPQTLGRN